MFDLKEQRAKEEAKPQDERIATLIHSETCNHNHTDGCGWEYEKSDCFKKEGKVKNKYWKVATELMQNGHTYDSISDALYLVHHIKKSV